MIGTTLLISLLAAGPFATPFHRPPYASTISQAQAPAQATPAEAAPFLGDWTLVLEGPNGPGTFGLSVKVEKDTVVGEISNPQMPKQAITDISKDKSSLVLRYSFTWEGNPVDAAVSLTPSESDKVAAQIDFAGGAYVMSGTASKKDASK